MSQILNTDGLSDEEVQQIVDRGDAILREGYDDDGNEVTQYELTEQGQLRVMCNGLVGVLDTIIAAHRAGRGYNKVIDYVKGVRASIKMQSEEE